MNHLFWRYDESDKQRKRWWNDIIYNHAALIKKHPDSLLNLEMPDDFGFFREDAIGFHGACYDCLQPMLVHWPYAVHLCTDCDGHERPGRWDNTTYRQKKKLKSYL